MNIKFALIFTLLIISISSYASDTCVKITVAGQGDNVMLIPGFMSDGRVWQEVYTQLSTSHRVHLVEIAGFGDTPPCHAKQQILPQVKNELLEYLRQPNMSNTQVIGHSLGAFMAYWIAIDNPTITQVIGVDGLPYIGPIFTRNKESQVSDLEAQVPFLTQMYQNASSAQLAQLTQSSVAIQATTPENQQRVVTMAAASDGATAASALETLMLTDLRTEVKKIPAPVTLISAFGGLKNPEQFVAAQALYQAQVDLFSHGRLIVNHQDRHFMMWDDFVGFMQVIKPLLTGESQ